MGTQLPQFAADDRVTDTHRVVVATWSGGIDSTGVVAHLLARGYTVHTVSFELYGGDFGARERTARRLLASALEGVALAHEGLLVQHEVHDMRWLWAFGTDGVEIPHRNKRILDYLCDNVAAQVGTRNVAMGEYIGVDTWLVRDHVSGADADARALAGYLFNEYGLEWRLFTLADFGESRFKADRLRLAARVLGGDVVHTTNCLYDSPIHCGACYKCQERAAAFCVAGLDDCTVYARNPRTGPLYEAYTLQQLGRTVPAELREAAVVRLAVDVHRMPRATFPETE